MAKRSGSSRSAEQRHEQQTSHPGSANSQRSNGPDAGPDHNRAARGASAPGRGAAVRSRSRAPQQPRDGRSDARRGDSAPRSARRTGRQRERVPATGSSDAESSTGWRGAGNKVVESVKEHPLPAIMIGTGLTWLLLGSRPARTVERRLLEQARRAAGGIGEAVSGLGETARESYGQGVRAAAGSGAGLGRAISGAAGSVKSGAAVVADYAQHGASAVGGAVRSGAASVGKTARSGYERGRDVV